MTTGNDGSASISIGSSAADASLADAAGANVALSSLWSAKPLVLVFLGELTNPHTADNAAQIRDAASAFEHVGAGVAAIIPDDASTLAAFDEAYNLPYLLLADPGGQTRAAYGVTISGVFLIDTSGIVQFADRADAPGDHQPTGVLVEACTAITGVALPEPPPKLFTETPAIADPKMVAYVTPPCPKCGGADYERYDVSTAGGWISRIFNFQRRKFVAVTCNNCGYTELFRRHASGGETAMDILVGR